MYHNRHIDKYSSVFKFKKTGVFSDVFGVINQDL